MKVESVETANSRRGIVRWAVISAIILVLLIFLVPVADHGSFDAKRTSAENTAFNLKNAISTYYTEYRRYPVNVRVADAVVDSDHKLMDVLLGADKSAEHAGLNPRRIAFFTGKAGKSMSSSIFHKGITLDSDGGGELWDPWGNHYRIQMDADHNNKVDNPETPEMDNPGLPESILVWSAGPDGDFNTWEDNPKTW